MRRPLLTVCLLATVLLAGCASSGGSASPGTTPTSQQTVTQTKTVPPPSQSSTKTAPAPTGGPSESSGVLKSFTMPNEVGKVLQTAQDDLQRVSGDPVFVSHSTDATGQDRFQILDRDWKVCSQNVAPGHKVTWDGHVVFNVVKLEESCP